MIQTESEQPLISHANEGGRFPCCITLEDISVDVCTNFTSALSSCVETPCWDEMRVVFFRDGVTQTTRWLSPAVAMHQMTSASAKRIGIDKGSSERLPGITEVKWSPINTAAYTVYFRFLDKDADHSLDPGYERPVFSTNLKYLDSYNTDDADRLRSKVSPKIIHPFHFSIECRNPNRAFVYTGGEGERPTSAKVEAMSAYYSRCVSKISTVFRKASIKLSSGSTEGSRSVEGEAADRLQTKGHGIAAIIPLHFTCVISMGWTLVKRTTLPGEGDAFHCHLFLRIRNYPKTKQAFLLRFTLPWWLILTTP
ncbi:hypothetical protein TCDM_00327 [Trypanosoma cruzi Dm28c]|uniref:Uncharacterized protein n=1 Tax=Trypanosoma cruzi Dm28c TaxID=1416333 RepID=V5C252_TRYCR|nr:hypothetical protein TCDM_00327 [Trypanosoma cruzi Dm28c]